ncbi:MAG: type II secretion system F family protein [Planctomycetota bacterium]
MIIFLFAGPVVLAAFTIHGSLAGAWGWDLARFTSFLAATLKRSLPLGSSLAAFAQETSALRPAKRRMLLQIADATDNGSPLSDELDEHNHVFSAAFRALVRAGERSGNLAKIGERLKEMARLRRQAMSRAAAYVMYPLVVAGAVGFVTWSVAVVVFPSFAHMLSDIGVEKPGALAFIQGAVEMAERHWYLFPLVPCAVLLAWRGVAFASAGSLTASGLSWHTPLLKRYERRRAVSQYALVAGRLMEAGIAEPEALEIAARSSGNACMDRIALIAAVRVTGGAKLSDALRIADPRGELPPEFAWYIEVGEASGRLPEALTSASESAAERSRSALGGLVRLIAPAGVLACACLVGLLGYAVFETLITMMEAF